MNLKDANAILDVYEGLRETALWIVDGAPYWKHVPYDGRDWATLAIDGDEAVLRWPAAYDDYGSSRIDEESISFPANLLFLSKKELTAWKTKARADYDKAQAERNRKIAAEQLEARRLDYEKLRAEFEPVRVYDKKPASSRSSS